MAARCLGRVDIPVTQSVEAEQPIAPTGNVGVIFLDKHSRIVDANQRARQMLASGAALCSKSAILCAPNGYAQAVADAITKVVRDNSPAREVLVMRIPQLRLPVAIAIQSYRTDNTAAVVTASDPNLACVPDHELLRALYGLTPAEIRVAGALTTCQSITQIAKAQNIAANTVRTHLKRLFQKTGCRRQSDLVAVLLTAPVYPALPSA